MHTKISRQADPAFENKARAKEKKEQNGGFFLFAQKHKSIPWKMKCIKIFLAQVVFYCLSNFSNRFF
jgi:hypothetical protein